jgi:Rrf2 family transcriptional regulator, cysteine metabolism repressor
MKLSRCYAPRALLEMALNDSGKPMIRREIAQKQKISLEYFQHFITPLIAAGMVRTVRGPKGGVMLARQPDQIRLSEVIHLFEGSVAALPCVESPKVCSRADSCAIRDTWCQVREAVSTVLDSVTLEDLVECHQTKKTPKEPAYYI